MKKLILTAICCLLAVVALPLQASALDRIGAKFTDGNLYLKEGAVNSGWRPLTSGVNIGNYSLAGDRISLLDQGNSQKPVSIKEPFWNSAWNWTYYTDGGQPAATKSLVSQLSNGQYRLLVLRADGSVVMKDGPWNTGWWSGTIEPSGVSDIVIGGDRIGVVTSGGVFKVKQLTPGQFSHPSNVNWDTETTGASVGKVALTNTRIAFIDSSNNIYVKEGATTAPWFGASAFIFSNSSKVQLASNRVCSLGTGVRAGVVECKDGALDASSQQVYSSNANDVDVSANRVVVKTSSNNLLALEGPLYSANSGWQTIGTNVTAVEIN